MLKLILPELWDYSQDNITQITFSELAKIEFASVAWRKVREKEFTEFEARGIYHRFETDFERYDFVPVSAAMIVAAKRLIEKYGTQGLRTLDSIQLATAVNLKKQCQLFVTSDKLLRSFFIQEALPVF